MINFGLRCGQMMAERSDLRHMNQSEREVLWYRLERIGKTPPEPEPDATPQPTGLKSSPVKTESNGNHPFVSPLVLQLKAEVVGWRQKHAGLQLAVDKLTALLVKKSDGF